jgi:hypothetical protein
LDDSDAPRNAPTAAFSYHYGRIIRRAMRRKQSSAPPGANQQSKNGANNDP